MSDVVWVLIIVSPRFLFIVNGISFGITSAADDCTFLRFVIILMAGWLVIID